MSESSNELLFIKWWFKRWIVLCIHIRACVYDFAIVSKWNLIYLHKNGSMKRFDGLRRCKRTKVAKDWANGNSKCDSDTNQQQQM